MSLVVQPFDYRYINWHGTFEQTTKHFTALNTRYSDKEINFIPSRYKPTADYICYLFIKQCKLGNKEELYCKTRYFSEELRYTPTIRTNGLSLLKGITYFNRKTIDNHKDKLEKAGVIKYIECREKATRKGVYHLKIFINPDLIAYSHSQLAINKNKDWIDFSKVFFNLKVYFEQLNQQRKEGSLNFQPPVYKSTADALLSLYIKKHNEGSTKHGKSITTWFGGTPQLTPYFDTTIEEITGASTHISEASPQKHLRELESIEVCKAIGRRGKSHTPIKGAKRVFINPKFIEYMR